MAIYEGNVNNHTELLQILREKCVAHGWALTGDILSKGRAYVRTYIATENQAIGGQGTPANTAGSGIIIQGGTGINAGALVDPSMVQPRLGRPMNGDAFKAIEWPASYTLHIFENPDEVYLILNFSTQYYYYLAFGVSAIPLPGTGLWICGSSKALVINYNLQYGGFSITEKAGLAYSSSSTYYVTAPFWHTSSGGYNNLSNRADTMHTGFDGRSWCGSGSSDNYEDGFSAVTAAQPHIARSPNQWNQEAVLLPIHAFLTRKENKRSLVLSVENARYVRVDNYAPGDIVTLGTEKWRIYPFYFKNAAERNGSTDSYFKNHSGTFGWAIRYQ